MVASVVCGLCSCLMSAPLPTPTSAHVQDLQQYRQHRRQESLRMAQLPPELAALKSTAAAVELKQQG